MTIKGNDFCHPRFAENQVHPCAILLEADARAPDGDTLTYEWSGCASGSARTATCGIERIDSVVASVVVTDAKGQRASASKVLEGRNAAPVNDEIRFSCGYFDASGAEIGRCSHFEQPNCPATPTRAYVNCMYGSFNNPVLDQEGDEIFCDDVVVRGSGCPRSSFYECGGAADAASFDFRTPTTPTVCTFEPFIRDGWGARTKVATIRLPIASRE